MQQLACNQRVHQRVHPGPTNQKHLPDPQTNVFSYIRGGEKLNNGIAQYRGVNYPLATIIHKISETNPSFHVL